MRTAAVQLGPWRISRLAIARFNAWSMTAFAIFAVPVVGSAVAQTEEHVKGFSLPFYLVVQLCVIAGVVMPGLTVLSWHLYRQLADAPKVAVSARCLTRMAVVLAGPKRAALRAEWASHLSGETGTGLPSRRQARDALGFVASAVRYRLADAADAAWTPVDAVLKSRTLSNLFALMPTGLAALILFRHGGTVGLLRSAESVSAIYITLYALVLAGRKYRDLKPPEPKARRARELSHPRLIMRKPQAARHEQPGASAPAPGPCSPTTGARAAPEVTGPGQHSAASRRAAGRDARGSAAAACPPRSAAGGPAAAAGRPRSGAGRGRAGDPARS